MRGILRSVQNFLGEDKGALTAEFVAVTPILLVALAFSFEFGRALWAYDVMTRDVRGAVRYLARNAAYAPSDATVQTRAENLAKTGSPTGTVTHFPWNDDSATFTYTTARTFTDTNFNENGSILKMTASLPLPLPFLSILPGIADSYTLVVSDEARYIGE